MTALRAGIRRQIPALVLLVLCATSVAADSASPSSMPLMFQGVYTKDGQRVAGLHTFGFSLWRDSASKDEALRICSEPSRELEVREGSFEFPISDACKEELSKGLLVWYELSVDDTVYSRQRVGAVPQALWSASAAKAKVVGQYCGSTAPTTGAFSHQGEVGLAAARKMCQETCGSSTAHICVFEDLQRQRVTGTGNAGIAQEGWTTSIDIEGTLRIRDGSPSFCSPIAHGGQCYMGSKQADAYFTDSAPCIGYNGSDINWAPTFPPKVVNSENGSMEDYGNVCSTSLPIHCCD